MKLKQEFISKTKEQRLYQVPCPVIGLTGGIATGKSSVSSLLQEAGVNVICADKLVKIIYQDSETISFINTHFPQAVSGDIINFKKLREIAFSKSEHKIKLEKFIYQRLPIVFKEEFNKLTAPEVLVYDVPLLFEKSMHEMFDVTICVYARKDIQIERIIKRDNSTVDLAEKVLQNQIPINEKKNLSDFYIENNGTKDELRQAFELLRNQLLE